MSSGTIFINGRFVTQRQTGVQRFAGQAVSAIDRLLEEPAHRHLRGRIVLLVPQSAIGRCPIPGLRRVAVRPGGAWGGGYAWEQFDLPRLSASGVLLNLCNLGPLAKRRQVVVVHDATPCVSPESFSLGFRLAYRGLIPLLGRRAERIVTVSEFSRREIERCYAIPAAKIAQCGEGSDHLLEIPPDTTILERHGLAQGGFFLAVGVGSPNKNIAMAVAAFQQANLPGVRLVLTGQREGRVHGGRGTAASDRICPVGHVSDGALRALYESALGLVFPSRYEGFGLPPLEAMACGCPVIISDQPALLEVAGSGDAALICEMHDRMGLADLLRRLQAEAGLRAALSANGRVHAARFRWARTAGILLQQCLAIAE